MSGFLHTMSGLAFVFFLVIKIALHVHLDRRHGRILDLPTLLLALPLFFQFYRSEVKPEFKLWKSACNVFLILCAVSFVINAAAGVLILLWFSFNPFLIRS